VEKADWGEAVALLRVAADAGHVPAMVRRYMLNPGDPHSLKAPGFQPLEPEM
jgi:hypothetical protein